MSKSVRRRWKSRLLAAEKRTCQVRYPGALCLSGGHNMPVRQTGRRAWCWADRGARGHGLGSVGHAIRLCNVDVLWIGTMYPRRRGAVGEIVRISSVEFLCPPLC